MSFVIGNTRLSSKGYGFFHALYFKDQVILESTFDAAIARELMTAELIEPIELVKGAKLSYTPKGKVLSYLFYINGEMRSKHLTKLCNWQDNDTLRQVLDHANTPKDKDELREYAEFLWWLNQIRRGIEVGVFTLDEVITCLELPLTAETEGTLKLTLNNFPRQLSV